MNDTRKFPCLRPQQYAVEHAPWRGLLPSATGACRVHAEHARDLGGYWGRKKTVVCVTLVVALSTITGMA